ncbi:MAG: hypothetical protein ACLFQB_08510 [Chitinispirillaceae bacterium]
MNICTFRWFIWIVCVWILMAAGSSRAEEPVDSTEQKDYRIDDPGTITFTVGTKIKGKVDKPQVMIFLPKERSFYRDMVLTKSFSDEIMQPLPLIPLVD